MRIQGILVQKIDTSQSERTRIWPAASLQVVLSALLFAVVLVVGSVLTILNYQRSRELAGNSTGVLFQHVEREMALQLNGVYSPISQLVDSAVIQQQRLVTDRALQQRLSQLPSLLNLMQHNPALSSFYVGYDNGDFFSFRRINPLERKLFDIEVPAGATFLVRQTGLGPRENNVFIFLTDDRQVLKTVQGNANTYDPRKRSWYQAAWKTGEQIQTDPYLFFSTGDPGITVARRTKDLHGVVGADIAFDDLSALLGAQQITPSAKLALIDEKAMILAYGDPGAIRRTQAKLGSTGALGLADVGGRQFAAVAAKIRTRAFNVSFATNVEGRVWSGRVMPVQLGGELLYLAFSVPDDELLANADRMLRRGLIVTLILLLAAIPLAGVVAWRLGLPLRQLARGAKALQDFDFSHPIQVQSRIREIDTLICSMNETRTTIKRFTDISAALAAEQNFDRLLERILNETISIARADTGILYLLDDARKLALPQLVKWADGRPHRSASPPMLEIFLPKNAGNQLCQTLSGGKKQFRNTDTASLLEEGDAWLGKIPALLPAGRHTLATIPLKNRRDEVIGAILLLSPAKNAGAETHLFAFLEALSGTAAISIESKQLIKTQHDLLEAMIQVIAGAIDAKSPYTGGHCQRVPELTKMLAQAACDTRQGPFQTFTLSEDEWQEVHIASWLHDCGKMTTPEFVVDKATKLETIYDRVHEIRMRFEVIKRDRQITALKALLDGADAAVVEAALAEELKQLDEEFAFVASCNVGSEQMAPEHMARVRQIAQRTWLRTLDDRLGISWEERERKERLPAAALPVEEPLLDDRIDHQIARGENDRIAPDNEWGFKVQTPELLYNRGEIYNLCIKSGTLTPEERYKINEHIIQTIIMLNRLPFPRHLANVPEIAGGHHEKMNGGGYPKQLKREEMSLVARMMAVADIFEALTAADRPYKKGKKLSEAIAIMVKMKERGHIDPDTFALFMETGIYMDYAKKYMAPELIDEVLV
ncbi:HAMP domain-containing protein [Oxalobacteraceae bacterium CAVE-383]|nr:HAMP domain-containing protein [Oxalobacteraceae bacterium CAVE-383]